MTYSFEPKVSKLPVPETIVFQALSPRLGKVFSLLLE